eukprot:9551-Heterococcus_DN1.PRE.1
MTDAPQLDAAAAVGAKRPLEPVQDESNKLPRVESSDDSAIKVLAAATAAMAAAKAAPTSQPQDTSNSTTSAASSAPSQEPANSVALTAAAADTATAVSPLKPAAPAAATAVATALMPANPAAVPISSPLTAGEKACLARVELPAETGTRLVVLWQLEVEGVDREEWWPCTLQRSQNPRQDSHGRAVFELHYEAANGMCTLCIAYYAAAAALVLLHWQVLLSRLDVLSTSSDEAMQCNAMHSLAGCPAEQREVVFGVKGLLLDLEDEQTMSWAREGEQRDRDPDAEEETVDLAELSESDEPEVGSLTSVMMEAMQGLPMDKQQRIATGYMTMKEALSTKIKELVAVKVSRGEELLITEADMQQILADIGAEMAAGQAADAADALQPPVS